MRNVFIVKRLRKRWKDRMRKLENSLSREAYIYIYSRRDQRVSVRSIGEPVLQQKIKINTRRRVSGENIKRV